MKNIMNKKNRTSRIIALLLVLALIITPMMSYDGKRGGAKAADEGAGAGDTTGEVADASVETAQVTIDFAEDQLTANDVEADTGEYTLSVTPPTSEERYFVGEKVVGFDAKVAGDQIMLNGSELPIDRWDVKVVTRTAGDAENQVASFESPSDYTMVAPNTEFVDNSKVYVYAKPEVDGWTCTSYTLVAEYTLKKGTLDATCSWVGTSPAQSATLSAQNVDSKYVGVWKYGFKKTGTTDNITWKTENSSLTEEGEYTGYIGYFKTESSTEPSYKSDPTSIMVIDTTPPTVPNSVPDIKLYKGDSLVSGTADAIYDESTQTYYVSSSDLTDYKYKLTITDNNGGTGKYSIDGGATYTDMSPFENNSVDNSSTWTTTLEIPAKKDVQSVIVKDAAGNEIAAENAISLPGIVAVDRSLRFTVEPKLDGTPDPKTNTTYTMSFTAESGNKITGYTVETKEGTSVTYALTWEELNAQEAQKLPNGNYTYTANYQLPQTGVDYQKIDYVKVTVTDSAASKEYTIDANYVYDNAKPEVVKSVLRQKTATDSTSDYSDVPDNETIDGGVYVSDAETTEYRYYVQIKDKGVGVTNVEGCYDSSFSDASKKYTFTKDTEVTLDPTEDWYYTDLVKGDLDAANAKTLYIKASDGAGNTSDAKSTGIAVIKSDTKLKIDTSAVVLKKGKTVVDITHPLVEDVSNSASSYKLTFQISSGYEIDKVWLGYSSDVGTDVDTDVLKERKFNRSELNADGSGYTYDPVTKRYTATYTFEINMAREDLNEILNNMVVYGSDVNNDVNNKEVSADIGKLLYDNTKPIVKKIDGTNPDTSSETDLVTEPGWYNTFSFAARIKSGSQTVESSITSASYMISNSVESEKNGVVVDLTSSIDHGIVTTGIIDVPESAVPSGTVITFDATDKAGNKLQEDEQRSYIETVRVDKTKPTVDSLKVNDSQVNKIPLKGFPKVTTTISDKLALNNITINVTDPNGNVQTHSVNYGDEALAVNGSVSEDVLFELAPPSGMTSLLDGSYYVEVTATDKAGNQADVCTTRFQIDNTIPVVTAKIASGTMGGKKPAKNFDGTDCDYYYRSDVGVQLTYDDDNIDSVVVTDNGKVVNVTWTPTGVGNKQVANMAVSATGRHTIKINATDKTGNKAVEKQVVFVRDVAGPTITAVINGGQIYTENMGTVDITRDVNLSFSVSDANEDVNDFNYRLIKKLPDQPAVTGAYIKTTNRAMTYAEEADYTVEVYSVDMASNIGPTRNISFRVDKTAPDISISGGGNGGTSSGGVTLSFNMKEAFWWDASGNVTIYRKAGDGSTESQYKTIDYKPTAFSTAVSESLTETGTYRIEFTARDRAGHTANTTQTFTIDREAPVITLSGVDNYDKTDKDVTFMAKVADDFYTTKKVVLSGTREDASGTKNKLEFSSFNEAGNPTVINELFQKSGIYDIQVTSEDVAGNKDTQTVHFTIDKDKPEIGKLPIEEGSVTNVFDSVIDTDELVSDLTVCDVHMYLNGVEYDGDSKLEDGSYTLLITAEDELGNYSEKSVSFELDTKAPVFIVTGVEDGEVKNEAYSITISLQIAEDTLANVELNGKAVELTDNTATIEVTEKGKYTLTMSAVDKAQNYADQTITFRYGEKKNNWIWIVIGAGALLIIGGVIILIMKKRKK